MNIESKIRFKTIALYGVVAVAMAAMLLFLYTVGGNTRIQRLEVEQHRRLFSLTNDLIYAVGQTQSVVGRYVTTEDRRYAIEFNQRMEKVDSLILILSENQAVGGFRLVEISTLLKQQSRSVFELKRQFVRENPVVHINERLSRFEPDRKSDTLIVSTVQQDTLINRRPKRNFFQRLGEAFKPQKDSQMLVTNRRIDTIRVDRLDSLLILSEVDHMVRQAGETYQENMRTLEQQIDRLSVADQEIADRISTLLLQLYSRTLDTTVEAVDSNERSIQRGYAFLIGGGIGLLGLMLIFILLIMGDIKRWKEARAALEEANGLLREVMESRHRLLLAVAHDIKSPLNSIMGYLELAPKEREETRSMQNSSRHILALLENLLEFSSLEQGTLQAALANLSLRSLGDEVGEMFLPLARSKNLEFSYRMDDVSVYSDRMKLKQIVINLVSNAIKYTSRGAVSLSITYANSDLMIRVADTGVGIPQNKLGELYEPFVRVESNNALAHGTGLGLYVVKGLIELLGGQITLFSEEGKGTEITVIIPAPRIEVQIPKGAKRIALFDDDPVVLTVTRDQLLRLGHRIVMQDYDCVLTDMEMGERTGLDVLSEVGDVPVFVMTGRSDFSLEKAKELGFSGYLAKPFTIDDLRSIFGEETTGFDDFLGEDREVILELFRSSTVDNFKQLIESIGDNDFKRAQALCHKMLPMFAQLGYPIEELQRMDASRGHEYGGWKEDVETVLSIQI